MFLTFFGQFKKPGIVISPEQNTWGTGSIFINILLDLPAMPPIF
jgi:hypothetical protein